MGAGDAVRRTAALCAVVLLLAGRGLAAQEPVARPAKAASQDVRGRALEKLRALERASRPAGDGAADPATAQAPDTAAAAAPDTAAAPVIIHMSPDSFAQALRNLDGYTLTEYRAENRARFAADSGRLELIGAPTLSREGQGIRADSLLVYNEQQAVLCGYGKPVMEGTGGEPVESDRVCYNVDRRVGVALGARTKFTESATWFVHGKELYTAGDDRIYGANADFTSCDIDAPHYHFAAKGVKIVHDEILVARDVTLTFRDVPVFWLPFLVQSMKRGRRSGLLTPDFSLTDIVRNRSGYDRRISNIGFYWAINDYMGARAAFDWWSDHWTALNAAFDYSWKRQFLQGGVDLTRYWQENGSRELSLRTHHSWRNERTSLQVSGNFTSAQFVEQYAFDPRQLDRSIQSSAGLNHRFDWGTLNVSANRTQYLTDERTMTTLPSVSLSLNPVTLFAASGEPRWYNNATWNANVGFDARSSDLDESKAGAANRDGETRTGRVQSSFQIWKLSWSQNASIVENVRGAKDPIPDTTMLGPVAEPALPHEISRQMEWGTSLGFQQRLIGTSTLSPSLSLRGTIVESDSTGGRPVAGPTRLTFGASLNTNLYGFWPGFGPFSRLRHRIDPSLSYSYSPVPRITDRQREVFGEQAGKETNQLSLRITQTWEAKYATADSAAEAPADTAGAAAAGAPRRLPQARKITLLSLRTDALVYDFTEAREGRYGLQTTQLNHSISSDLLQGLALTVGHDLFRLEDAGEGMPEKRTFAPRIRRVETSFSLGSDSWLFRALGLGRPAEPDTAAADSAAADSAAAAMPGMPPGSPFMGPGGADRAGARGAAARLPGGTGSWRANLSYSLIRPPAGADKGQENQLLRGTVSFQPTENWSVNWQTSYSFTDGEFSDHVLTLTRDLHDWQANFDFIKARNGNFMFSFRVHLLANSDIKFEYDERYEGLGTSPQP